MRKTLDMTGCEALGCALDMDGASPGRFTLSGGGEEMSLGFAGQRGSVCGMALSSSLTLVMDVFNPQETNETLFVRFFETGSGKTMEMDAALFPQKSARVTFEFSRLNGQLLFPPLTPGTLKRHVVGDGLCPEDIGRLEIGLRKGYTDTRRLEVKSVFFTDEPVDFPSPEGKTADDLGQWKQKMWPGKTEDAKALEKALKAEAAAYRGTFPKGFDALGGEEGRRFEASGYFRVEKREGRWHLVDPGGHGFFSLGVFGVYPGEPGWIRGVQGQFDWLPDPEGMYAPAYARAGDLELYRRKFSGMFPDDTLLFAPATANLIRAFGEGWYEKWADMTAGRLRAFGLNTLSMFSDPAFIRRSKLPYVIMLKGYPVTEKRIFREFPDVYAPAYEALCRDFGAQLAAYALDPLLIGYFLNNEPTWGFIPGLNLAEKLLETGEHTYSLDALIGFLQERYHTAEELNSAWRLSLNGFAELRAPLRHAASLSAAAERDLKEFTGRMIDRYAALPAKYARAAAPNHLNLGMRFAAMNNRALLESSRHFDVFSFNCYKASPAPVLAQLSETIDKPMLVGEFHFGALDAGLPSPSLFRVAGQKERGEAYTRYVQSAARHPNAVGVHYFAYNDQPLWGRYDGENYQFGFVDVCNMPYRPFTDRVRDANAAIYEVIHGRGEILGGETVRL